MKLRNYFKTTIPFKKLAQSSPLSENDTRILLEDLFRITSTDIIKNPYIKKSQAKKFFGLANRVRDGLPLQYAVGFTYFCGLKFKINKNVLIPRPESETIVELAKEFLKGRMKQETRIIDIGTGSGCIAIALSKIFENQKNFKFLATDISKKALKIAKINASNNKVNLSFFESNLFSSSKLPKKVDLIISNLPYVDENDKNEKLKFEPQNAIYCSDEGFELIEKLLRQLPNRLEKDGLAILEIGYNHTARIQSIAKELNQMKFSIQKDLGNFPRYLLVQFKKDMPPA